jgi:cytoskeletal protein RodZ
LTLDAVARTTNIPAKYLHALETSRYDELPGAVYVRNFLRICSTLYHLNSERVLELYARERRIAGVPHPPSPPHAIPTPRTVHLPRLLRTIAIVAMAIGFLGYLGLKVQRIVEPPMLNVLMPTEDATTTERSITVSGVTEPESTVTINGQSVFLGTDGQFSETVTLQSGLNVIKISSRKKRSQERTVYRRIISEQPAPRQETYSRVTDTHL